MRHKCGRIRDEIRYSEAFKMKVVRELEGSECTFWSLRQKYRIKGASTINKWLIKYGNGTRGKVIRVEKPDEINERVRLWKEVRKLKEALADEHLAFSLEKAYLGVACEQMGQSVEEFKKKNAGRRRSKQ